MIKSHWSVDSLYLITLKNRMSIYEGGSCPSPLNDNDTFVIIHIIIINITPLLSSSWLPIKCFHHLQSSASSPGEHCQMLRTTAPTVMHSISVCVCVFNREEFVCRSDSGHTSSGLSSWTVRGNRSVGQSLLRRPHPGNSSLTERWSMWGPIWGVWSPAALQLDYWSPQSDSALSALITIAC